MDEISWIQKPDIDADNQTHVKVGWLFHETCFAILEMAAKCRMTSIESDTLFRALNDEYIKKRAEFKKAMINEDVSTEKMLRRLREDNLNPLWIPGLQNVIQAAFDRPVPQPQPAERIPPGIKTNAGFKISLGAFYLLTIAIQERIANHIGNLRDLRVMILLGRWRLSDKFWINRIPDCIHEIHGISDTKIDWQWLGLEVLKLVEKNEPTGYPNRTRVHQYAKRIWNFYLLNQSDTTNVHNIENSQL
ncbi:hypothetical protein BGW36DRAFT_440770 [Talaromyces proteolyticus]|uniref:Uncharacterized protein n=1 Tax=Talaromyces proteolyticus TaxID=1131652 RepID=A0AAD4KFR7_9EURO|nr:uncharacterized protein BGW36DRAFT_440770 [Talaromyces proteolyticus]KAH8689991.1 hypothetical protein BGW36DRAFT_440770 [Talaromyces proteolyticus]